MKRGMKYDWVFREQPNEEGSASLSQQIGTSALVSKLLMMRGVSTFDDARSFFRPSLDELHDPFLMKDMDRAVNRLTDAIAGSEKILVYGDYDVDGTTSVAMMWTFLKAIGVETEFYQPDRYKEGYGVSLEGIEYARENGFQLIITLDCGIKANHAIALAKSASIDVIVCDHHSPGEELPDAIAVLDPCRHDCDYPYKGLSGCGVGFKLLQAFALQNGISSNVTYSFLDLVCVSIAADIVPITGENRIMAAHGLAMICDDPRPGIKALLKIAAFKGEKPDISDVVFILSPRINAAGRMAHASQAVLLLASTDDEKADLLAAEIEALNHNRRNEDQGITRSALESISNNPDWIKAPGTVVFSPEWHKGVIGIVASRLIETYYRPTIVLCGEGELITGSGRSIKGFDLYQALLACSEFFVKFGGHPMAAGMTMRREELDKFREKFNNILAEHFQDSVARPNINIDCELELSQLNLKDYAQIKQFGPFGPENMSPVFIAKGLMDKGSRPVGADSKHLKIRVKDPNNYQFDGIAFNMGEYSGMLSSGKAMDIVFSLSENNWQGNKTLQLVVKDLNYSEI